MHSFVDLVLPRVSPMEQIENLAQTIDDGWRTVLSTGPTLIPRWDDHAVSLRTKCCNVVCFIVAKWDFVGP